MDLSASLQAEGAVLPANELRCRSLRVGDVRVLLAAIFYGFIPHALEMPARWDPSRISGSGYFAGIIFNLLLALVLWIAGA